MKTRKLVIAPLTAFTLLIFGIFASDGLAFQDDAGANQQEHHHHLKKRHLASMGAGAAIGVVAGPGGRAAYGTVTHRHQLEAGGHKRRKAIVDIGAPVAAGAALGPPGSAGYFAVSHRKWIKHHVPGHHHHHSDQGDKHDNGDG